MVDDVVWDRVLNLTVEERKVYKNASFAFAENTGKISRIQQNNTDHNAKSREAFDFKKHVNTSSMNLTCYEMAKVRSLCTQFETIFSRNSNDMGFCNRIHHKINLKNMRRHSDIHMAA